MKKRLFVISMDSLFFDDVKWLCQCPNLWEIYRRGAVVKRMRSTYPAMTYVAHSTMMTGCYPDRHGIYHNEKVEVGVAHPPWHWYRRDLKVGTIFDAAKEKGYTICVVDWPVTGADPSIDYLVPEIWTDEADGDVRDRFLSACSPDIEPLFDRHRHLLNWDCLPELDDFGVACLKDILRDKRPDVVMLHLSYLDRARHDHGGFSPEARHALRECDRKLGELFAILRQQGIFEETNFFVAGDHGHLPVRQVFCPNILLAREGMIRLSADGRIADYRCYVHSAGLSAHVVLKNPDDREVRARVETLLNRWVEREDYGCERFFDRKEMAEYHLSGPFQYVIEGRPGTAFSNACEGDLIRPTDNSDYKLSVSGHGHLPDKGPQPIFFAAGPDIRAGAVVERGDLTDEAPTYAALLGAAMPWAQGRAIKEILRQDVK